jgi:hypothetical protein
MGNSLSFALARSGIQISGGGRNTLTEFLFSVFQENFRAINQNMSL